MVIANPRDMAAEETKTDRGVEAPEEIMFVHPTPTPPPLLLLSLPPLSHSPYRCCVAVWIGWKCFRFFCE
jgi:hypothetical protein